MKSSSTESPQLHPSIAAPLLTEAENPWLTVGNSNTTKLSRKRNETLVSKDSAAHTKSQAALKKQLARSDDALAREADDALVEIDVDQAVVPPPAEITTGTLRVEQSSQISTVDSAFRDSDDEGDEANHQGRNVKAFKQRDLVALAFAGDNVVEVGVLGCF